MTTNDAARAVNHCKQALRSAQLTRHFCAEDAREAEGHARETAESIRAALGVLTAPDTGELPPAPTRDAIPLALLDTPDTRELLSLLTRAQAVAERVDAARGRCLPESVPLAPGESRGTDLAEAVSLIALRVAVEVHGPPGRE
jgi:hypothetical protein